MTTVLKLGGSLITDKERAETLDGTALSAAADAIAECRDDLALVHGAGSFGHHYAEKHGVSVTEGTTDAGDALEIHGSMTTLNRFVLSRLHDRDVSALPVHPLSAGGRDADAALDMPIPAVRTMLGEGFVPVSHGDVIAHEDHGATIISGDEVVVRFAEGLDADRIGLCSTVDGVYDEHGDVIDHIEDFDAVADALGGSDATDVTGGMAGKVRTLLDLDAPAYVFGADDLSAFLSGGEPGTRIG
ncbi:isopentenyl phosphate kinase [Haloplanus aerogenes]|uniref:Isopentenyl phosphate kinase n=1 Tax=Haloplanus aerogenes TaxID=660522 RepID=A0A3M0DVN4_9EURY|nr:isopentenyl phosphate kinase [Haloplanus aerogenes]AZH25435.1 isopentenyl phosphate kinase family protein [Haloplanus aerogenes]RMB25147.1 isopentenyl phosphate kinase [Haloplanus aerogenes]